jgi:hypothetical protein
MPSLLENMRDTNRRLTFWLDSLGTGTGTSALPTPDHMAALLSELLRAGAGLRSRPASSHSADPDLDQEIAIYRTLVERMRDLLPAIHSQLLAERARLEAQRARVRSAAQWVCASRQTL